MLVGKLYYRYLLQRMLPSMTSMEFFLCPEAHRPFENASLKATSSFQRKIGSARWVIENVPSKLLKEQFGCIRAEMTVVVMDQSTSRSQDVSSFVFHVYGRKASHCFTP